MNSIRLGIVGLGFGEQLVRTVANMREFDLVAVADHESDRADRVGKKYKVKAYRDAVDMLETEALDAVSVAVSPGSRRAALEAACRKNLPMFVEKPWASDLEHAHELYQLLRECSSTVMTGFSFRFHPVVQQLRRLLDTELGMPWLCNASYVFEWLPPSGHWLWDRKNGNGFFNENSCHLLDVICFLLGKPVAVMAHGGRFTQHPSEDGASVSLRYEGGAIASISLGGIGTAAFNEFPRLDLVCKNGQAQLQGRSHVWEELHWALRGEPAKRTVSAPPEALGATRYTHAFLHFADCIRSGTKPQATIEDGMLTVALSEAIYRSIREGVEVPIADFSALGAAEL